jgi:hypothetical protein
VQQASPKQNTKVEQPQKPYKKKAAKKKEEGQLVYRRKEDTQMAEPTVVTPQKLNKPSPQGSKSKPQQSKK